MERITETMIQLISSEVCGNTLNLSDDVKLTEKFMVELLLLSRKHNVAHIVASALMNNGFLDNSPQMGLFMNEFYKAVYTREKLTETFDEVCGLFEEKNIPYIPLKGAVICNLYPQTWMRTSCDIDILVKEKDLQKAVDAIREVEGYIVKGESRHDIVIKAPNGTVVELHYKLLGKKSSPLYSHGILSKVWKSAVPVNETGCLYKLSDEVFYYYHIMHMAKHFRIGGCGIRPLLDLWLIDRTYDCDSAALNKLLKKGNLLKFTQNARKLSGVWFSGEEHNETTLQMQEYIINGGLFGSVKTRLISNNQRSGGKKAYILSRIFVPYSYLKRDYPILEKYPIFTPICEICRLCSFLFGKKKIFKDQYIENLNKSEENSLDISSSLFKDLGLK